jgi:hypothetical protein
MTNPLRDKLHRLIDEIVDALEAVAAPEWYDQTNSPLGRDRHLRLARSGTLKSSKEKGHIWIRRADIDAYLLKHTVVRVDPAAAEADELARVKALLEKKHRAA